MRLAQTLVAEEEVRRMEECSPKHSWDYDPDVGYDLSYLEAGSFPLTFHLPCHTPMPHFKEGGAGSRELLASGVDRGSGGQEKCPWRKDVGGATACRGGG